MLLWDRHVVDESRQNITKHTPTAPLIDHRLNPHIGSTRDSESGGFEIKLQLKDCELLDIFGGGAESRMFGGGTIAEIGIWLMIEAEGSSLVKRGW
jgi:hypothetical protein